jgi:hypothetical protein
VPARSRIPIFTVPGAAAEREAPSLRETRVQPIMQDIPLPLIEIVAFLGFAAWLFLRKG